MGEHSPKDGQGESPASEQVWRTLLSDSASRDYKNELLAAMNFLPLADLKRTLNDCKTTQPIPFHAHLVDKACHHEEAHQTRTSIRSKTEPITTPLKQKELQDAIFLQRPPLPDLCCGGSSRKAPSYRAMARLSKEQPHSARLSTSEYLSQ